jgi:radical SAM superfamily enzyme YgiQ (UPF0313 family)
VKLAVFTPVSSIHEELKDIINEFRPGLACLTAVSSQIPLIKKIGEAIKQIDPSIFIIIGGVHTTLNPEETISYDFTDAVCIGEGEKAVVELARQLELRHSPSQIFNLWIKNRNTGQVEENTVQPFIEDLDSLPFIDREMWDPFISNLRGMQMVLAGRGCPNKCAFCSNHVLAKVAEGRYVRFRSPNNIIAELHNLITRYGQIESVFLETETLEANLTYTYQLLSELAELNSKLSAPLKFGTNLVVTNKIKDNRDLLRAFKQANFKFFMIGLESGSEKIRSEVLNRPRYSNADFIEFCQIAREYDIDIYINVLIGLPGETRRDFEETIKCVRNCQPNWGISANIYFPYPGTKLFQLCQDQKLLGPNARTTISERTSSVLKLTGFSKWQIKKEYILFYYKVFKGYKPWTDIMMRTVYTAFEAFPKVKRLISIIFPWMLLKKLRLILHQNN